MNDTLELAEIYKNNLEQVLEEHTQNEYSLICSMRDFIETYEKREHLVEKLKGIERKLVASIIEKCKSDE